jgi:hypothetical protein
MRNKGLRKTQFLDDARYGFLPIAYTKKNAQTILVRQALGQKGECVKAPIQFEAVC